MQVPDICAALAACGKSQANLLQGNTTCCKEVPRALEVPKFAPNGRDFAVLAAPRADLVADPTATDSDTDSDCGNAAFELLPGDECQFCLMAILEGGSSGRRPEQCME